MEYVTYLLSIKSILREVKPPLYKTEQILRAVGVWGSQNFQTLCTWTSQSCQPQAPVDFTPEHTPANIRKVWPNIGNHFTRFFKNQLPIWIVKYFCLLCLRKRKKRSLFCLRHTFSSPYAQLMSVKCLQLTYEKIIYNQISYIYTWLSAVLWGYKRDQP